MPWLHAKGDKLIIALHVQPGAKRTEVVGLHGEALKVRLAAPPVDGKANEALIGFLAGTLDLAKSQLALVSGQTARTKRVSVAGLGANEIRRKLAIPDRPAQ